MVKKSNKKDKIVDLIVVTLLLILIAFISWFFNLKAVIGGTIYTVIPSLYMFLRKKKNYKKIFLGTILLGTLAGMIYDSVAYLNKTWTTDILIHWKFLGISPIDDIIGYTAMAFLIITFYEHFFDDEKNKKLSKNFSKGAMILSFVLLIVSAIIIINPLLLKIPYPYLILSLIAIIFPIVFAIIHPKIIPKFLMTGAYFFFVWFLAEMVALNAKTNGWAFPGQYIGLVTVFGVTFPFEELFFWMMWYAITVISYYEFFIDDQK